MNLLSKETTFLKTTRLPIIVLCALYILQGMQNSIDFQGKLSFTIDPLFFRDTFRVLWEHIQLFIRELSSKIVNISFNKF